MQVTDGVTELVYTVVPGLDGDGIATLWEYRVRRKRGALPMPPYRDYLPMPYLANAAVLFLEGKSPARGRKTVVRDSSGRVVVSGGHKRPRVRTDAPSPRPDDKRLVELVRRFLSTPGVSARQELAREFLVSPNTADDWIRRARNLAPDLPPPRRGRPRTQTPERTEQ